MADRRLARAIGLTTAVSGMSLVAAPRLALHGVGADGADPAPLLFRVVGMFMTVSGGLLTDGADSELALRWSVAQKAAAVLGVTWGVAGGQYRRRALLVAAFDGASAVLLARMLSRR